MNWTYDSYMASEEWDGRRSLYFRQHAKRCRACGSDEDIELHHLSHEKMGDEPDTDLVGLCVDCHAAVHAAARVNPELTMRRVTLLYLDWSKRKTHAPPTTKEQGVPRTERARKRYNVKQKHYASLGVYRKGIRSVR